MRQKTIIILFFGLSFLVGTNVLANINNFKHSSLVVDNDSLLKSAWDKFAKAVLKKDLRLIKSLSTECIRCDFCVTNTRQEDSLFNIYMDQNEKLWYDKHNSELCFVPIKKFIDEDFDLIFSEQIKERLLDTTKLYFADDNHNARVFSKPCIITTRTDLKLDFREVLVTSIDPTPKYEGAQFAFAFVKLNGQYKFCGFSTIP